MADSYYWLHGAAVLIEFPDRLAEPPRRAGWGTVVRQDEGTHNWFHFAPTTPTSDADGTLYIRSIQVRLEQEGTRVEDVHVRTGQRLFYDLRYHDNPSRLPFGGATVVEHFPGREIPALHGAPASGRYLTFEDIGLARPWGALARLDIGSGGLVLALRIAFTDPPGRVIFRNTGFKYGPD